MLYLKVVLAYGKIFHIAWCKYFLFATARNREQLFAFAKGI